MLKVLQSNRVTRLLDSGVMALFVNGALVASGPSPGEPGGCGFAFALGGATLAGEQDLGGSFILETAVDFSKIRVSRAKRGHGSLA